MLDFINKNSSTTLPTKPLDFLQQFNHNASNNKFVLQVSGNVFGSIAISGPVEIYYDPTTYKISQLKIDVSLFAGIFAVSLDMKIQDTNSSYYNQIYNDFIEEFETNSKTKDLGPIASTDDTANIYTVNGQKAGTTGVLGGKEPTTV